MPERITGQPELSSASMAAFALPAGVRWAGAAVSAAGTVLQVWAHAALGRNLFWGVNTRIGHQLVQSGPYRWVRHPMYSAFMLMGVGFWLLSANGLVGGAWLAGTALVLITRLGPEEAMLEEQFGPEYTDYRARTGQLWPRLRP